MRVSNVSVLSKLEVKNLGLRLTTMTETAKWGQKCHGEGGWVKEDPLLVGPEPDPLIASLI